MKRLFIIGGLALTGLGSFENPALASSPSQQHFDENVRPILEQKCIECHGAKREGEFDVRTRQTLLVGGESGNVVTVGSARESKLFDLVFNEKMPPKQSLSDDEVDVLAQWIDDGLYFSDEPLSDPSRDDLQWWSTSPILSPSVPASTHPVDYFVNRRQAEEKLTPSPPADSRTLIRRLTFDLHGLPPTPAQIEEFLSDCKHETGNRDTVGNTAYAALVDRLLSSPRYGERWARHWLDVVHYGETHGFDKDQRRDNAWPYRDYVIRALNEDKPYSEFIRQQLAGDVHAPDDPNAIVATGFLAAGPWDLVGHVEVREETVEKKRVRNLDRDDIVTSVFNTFQSTTVQCARCHSHKFDPIPRADYYKLQAVFAGIERADRPFEDRSNAVKRREIEANIDALERQEEKIHHDILSGLPEKYRQIQANIDRLERKRSSLKTRKSESPSNGYHSAIMESPDKAQWLEIELTKAHSVQKISLIPARPTDYKDTPGFGFPQRFSLLVSEDGEHFTTIADHSRENFPNPGGTHVHFDTSDRSIRRIRIEAHRLWERDKDYVFALAEIQAMSNGQNVALDAKVSASSSIDFGRWNTRHVVDGYDSRNSIEVDERTVEILEVTNAALEAQRLQVDKLIKRSTKTSLLKEQRKTAEALASARKALQELPPPKRVYAVESRAPRPIFDLIRGSEASPAEQVHPAALSIFPELSSQLEFDSNDESSARLALANWIASPENPLTWRSMANRVWHYHFGKGIVDTPNDFGRAGSMPSHPQLLDWLAHYLRDTNSLKALHRVMVTSQTYRQSSRNIARNTAIDNGNRFLWRMNARKLDAETVRDAILQVSGKLDLTMGGPGFEAFNYTHDHSPRYDFLGKDTPDVWRRSIYRYIVRSVPDPLLEALDCADPNMNTPVRNETLTAPQALAMLNDAFVLAQSKHTANRLSEEYSSDTDQISTLFKNALGRLPTDHELNAMKNYVDRHGLAALARLTFNLNEFMFVD